VNGQVVRDGSITITEDRGGIQTFSSATSQAASGTCASANSPYSRIEVRDSANALVFSANSPQKDLVPGLPILGYTRAGAWSTPLTLTGKPAGTYTVTTIVRDVDRHRVNALQQQCILKPETSLPSVTFEYRPWQHTFSDFFGGGTVNMNVDPAEFSGTIGTASTGVVNGSGKMTFFAGAGSLLSSLPTDPAACGTDPASCVPTGAVQCDPSAGCVPQFVVISHTDANNRVIGVFDIDDGIFAAVVKVGSQTRVLFSAGPQLDPQLHGLIGNLITSGAANGLDVLSLLATKLEVKGSNGDGSTTSLKLSLLEGLALNEHDTGTTGAQIRAEYGLAAGAAILHTYTYLLPYSDCGKYGYRVSDSELIPQLDLTGAPASVAGLAALLGVGGPVKRVTGHWPQGAGSHTITPLSVDTAADEPNGLPVWLPVVSGTGPALPDHSIDFAGLGTVVTTEQCIAPIPILAPQGAVIGFGLLLGTGVALFDNPLPIGLDDIPLIWDHQDPQVIALRDQVSAAINSVTTQVLANSTVQSVLDQVIAAIPLASLLGG
jgi:hypothetical protein